jgi:hypothetical protein
MATNWKWKVFLLELGFVECMASNWKWQVFLLELGLLSAWLPIESEKCFYLSLGCWVHGFQLKVKSVFTWAWVVEFMASHWKWKVFVLELGLLSSCGVCFWTTMQWRERENGSWDWEKCKMSKMTCVSEKARWESKMTYVLRKWSQIGCGKRTQKTTHLLEEWHTISKSDARWHMFNADWVLPKQSQKPHTPTWKVFSRNMILLRNEGNHDSHHFYHKIVGARNPKKNGL